MGLFERFPYTNFHELNADWMLRKVKELDEAMKTFIAEEAVKFADPIIWSISSQYAKSTIVMDTSGNAFLSKQPVPAGIQLNNGDYWLEVFNFADYVRTANQNLTAHVEADTTRATAAYNVDDWLLWDDVLYKVTVAIAVDDLLVVNGNIVHFTVEDFIKAFITYATGLIQQYKNDIDYSELQYRNQLAQDIANTTQSLQQQLNQAISGATVDSEVILARAGINNITYSTLGTAINTQVQNLTDGLTAASVDTPFRLGDWSIGGSSAGGVLDLTNRFRIVSKNIMYTPVDIYVGANAGYKLAVMLYQADGTFISDSSWQSSRKIEAGSYFRITVRSDPQTTNFLTNAHDYFEQLTFALGDGKPVAQLQHDANLAVDNKHGFVGLFVHGIMKVGGFEERQYCAHSEILQFDAPITIKFTSPHRGYLAYVDNTDTVTSVTGWGDTFHLPANTRFILNINKSDIGTALLDIQLTLDNTLFYVDGFDSTDEAAASDELIGTKWSHYDWTATYNSLAIFSDYITFNDPVVLMISSKFRLRVRSSDGTFDKQSPAYLGTPAAAPIPIYVPANTPVMLLIGYFDYESGSIVSNDVPFTAWKEVLILNKNTLLSKYCKESLANIKSIAHRGGDYAAPENTLIAFYMARLAGYKYVETDIRLTSDGIAVLLHDTTIDRTSDGSGAIDSMTYAQADAYNYNMGASQFGFVHIPTFEEFIKLCKWHDLSPVLELGREVTFTTSQLQDLIDTVSYYGMSDKVLWASFNHSSLNNLKTLWPSAKCSYEFDSGPVVEADVINVCSDPNNTLNIWANSLTTNIVDAIVYYRTPVILNGIFTDIRDGIDTYPFTTGIYMDFGFVSDILN